MGLRINTNIASQEVQKNLKVSNAQQEAEFSKLSSGKRITKSADDAAGLAIAKKLEAETRGLRVAGRNANDAISMVQVAEGGLNETSNILTRLRELSIQAGSDTVGDTERGYLSLEYEQLVQEADRISKTTSFNGRPLLKGEGNTLQFQVGAYGGEDNRIEFDAASTDASSESLGIGGSNIRDKQGAIDNLERIDNAINKVSAFRANFGSIQSRLQSTINNLDVATVNQEAARSRIEDVDVADSTAKLASSQIRNAAGTATLSQANQLGNSALRLIG
ncbi:flagellin N-terminal helical domain-containing protein [Peredibacter starrii]|uniref:Flagellin n=1 Tax=Peredibacter starrii TaxID=28202 RepID=A0AAX4HQ69_9BACT|nr:flagellin [Peredibacter starrii]WPU65496.1 flagellin [Peredibacter starrii]